jgi:tetratricopeptide (TPR) repeat protein
VPLDREATLKKAEKLLRQGKLDGAIAEYVRVVEDQPRDWNSINALGDLYVRAGEPEKAIAQFSRVADHLFNEGFWPKAAALYKKILKIKKDDEHTLMQLADIAARQGVFVDAKTYLRHISEHRRRNGDDRGAAAMIVRIGTLDPDDADAKVAAARAAQTLDEDSRACQLWQEAADAYEKQKRVSDALAALGEAMALAPEDADLRARLLTGLLAQGDAEQARRVARTAQELLAIAALLDTQDRKSEALDVMTEALQLDPENTELRVKLARESVIAGNLELAKRFARTAAELLMIAGILDEQHRPLEALDVMEQALQLDHGDIELRSRVIRESLTRGDLERAKRLARTAGELLTIAAMLEQEQRVVEALDVMVQAAELEPADVALRTRIVRQGLAIGDRERARRFLSVETAGDDTALLLLLGQYELEDGRLDEGKQVLTRLLTLMPARRDELVVMACNLADRTHIDAAYTCVELVADVALLEDDWAAAAAALHEFVTRVPNQIPALMKLVEICVDGGLESTMYMAQAQLADAYLAAGMGPEARVIAEDLVAREPWERANIDRFRRALIMLGEQDPDGLIAERLSGESPFTTIEGTLDLSPPSKGDRSERPLEGGRVDPFTADSSRRGDTTGPSTSESGWTPPSGSIEEPNAPVGFREESNALVLDSGEIDLSDALSDLRPTDPPVAPPPDLESVFQDLRLKASRQTDRANAKAQYSAGLDHLANGRIPEAVNALEAAARVPMMRFLAASQLGRVHIAREDLQRAVEWFERAAEAPAPTAEEGFTLLYDLADTLEKIGENARALAVLLELAADAGAYRDVASRIDRLSKVQTGS